MNSNSLMSPQKHREQVINGSLISKKIHDVIFTDQRNYVAMMTGKPGTGKTYSVATILKSVDPTFHVHRVFFTVEQVAQFVQKDPPRGTAFMLDEAGHAAFYRKWYSMQNEQLINFLQTWRHRGWIFVMVAPRKRLVDKANHPFFDQIMETQKVYHKEGYVRMKVKDVQDNTTMEKIYNKYPVAEIDLGEFKRAKIGSVFVKRPGRNFEVPYEKRKKEFTDRIFARANFLLSGDTDKVADDATVKKMTPLQEKIFQGLWAGRDKKEIAQEIGISYKTVVGHTIGIRKKGFELPPRGYRKQVEEEEEWSR